MYRDEGLDTVHVQCIQETDEVLPGIVVEAVHRDAEHTGIVLAIVDTIHVNEVNELFAHLAAGGHDVGNRLVHRLREELAVLATGPEVILRIAVPDSGGEVVPVEHARNLPTERFGVATVGTILVVNHDGVDIGLCAGAVLQ